MKRENLQQMIAYLSGGNRWYSARQIADYLHTTPRTVRNYVQEINSAAVSEPPILASRKGYRWNVTAGGSPQFYHLQRPEPQTPEERSGYVLRQLLYGRPVGYLFLTMRLAVSERTLDTDLQGVKSLLRPYGLRLRRSQDRLFLEGSQAERRRLSFALIEKTVETDFLSMKMVAGAFPEYDVRGIQNALQTVLCRYGRQPDGYTQYDLLLRVVLQVQQIAVGNTLEEKELEPLELAPADFRAAEELADMLSQLGNIRYTDPEIRYLAALLTAKTEPLQICTQEQPGGFGAVQSFALQALGLVGRHIQADFFSGDFPLRVAVFFQRMLVRQRMKLYTRNPLYARLRACYPKLQDICLWIMEDFSRTFQVQIHASEIGFLTMIMAEHLQAQIPYESPVRCTLICPRYQTMAAELTRELKARLGSAVTLRAVEETMDLESMDEDSDLILSVVPMRYFPHLVTIAPFPKSEDFLRIRQEIAKIKRERWLQELARELPVYLPPRYFQTGQGDKSRDELLCAVCDQWERDGVVTPEFKTRLLCREAMEETTFFHAVALPHLCEGCVRQNALYCVVEPEPRPWGGEKINILVVMAFRPEELETFWKLYDLLIKLFSDSHDLRRLLGAADYGHFLQILSGLDANL